MKKHTSKLVALALALCLCLCMSVTAFAADVSTPGGSGSTPVNLSSTDDGTPGGTPSATAIQVLKQPNFVWKVRPKISVLPKVPGIRN